MVTGRPLFPGQSDQDQLLKIFKTLGTPQTASGDPLLSWSTMTELPEYKTDFPDYSRDPAFDENLSNKLSEPGKALLNSMLTYNPSSRVSAKDALRHEYFDDLDPRWKSPEP